MKNKLSPLKIFLLISFLLISAAVFWYSFIKIGYFRGIYPNLYEAYYGYKYYGIFLLAIFANSIIVIILYKFKKHFIKVILIAFIILSLIIALFFAIENIPTKSYATYNLGNTKYIVPVQYNPEPILHIPRYCPGSIYYEMAKTKIVDNFDIEVTQNFEPVYTSANENKRGVKLRIYQNYDIFRQKYFLPDKNYQDMESVINDDINSKPFNTNLRSVIKEDWSKKYYYQLGDTGQIVRLITCATYSSADSCGYYFSDGNNFYDSIGINETQVNNTEYRESLEKNIINLFQSFRVK